MGMYISPVVFPTSLLPEWRLVTETISISPRYLFALNPMVGVIEGFRAALLGTQPMPWAFIGIGFASASIVLLSGLAFFHNRERIFADVA
jgi:lipopolysaccharide transport system permease protein